MSNLIRIYLSYFLLYWCEGGRVCRPKPKIINGTQVKIEDYPFQVSLQTPRGHFCGGVIIAPIWILTAGHCVFSMDQAPKGKNYILKAGSASLKKEAQSRQIDSYILHPEYNYSTNDNDIGIIKLKKPLTLDATVQPIKISRKKPSKNTMVYVSGFGATSDRFMIPSPLLLVAKMKAISLKECQGWYKFKLPENIWCAGLIGASAFKGDSGGPVVIKARCNRKLLVGLVSGGPLVVTGQPNMYNNVVHFRPWIKKVTGLDINRSIHKQI